MSQTVPTRNEVGPAARHPSLVNPKDRIGLAVLVVMFLAGLWLMVAPFLVGYQARGGDWSNGTLNEFAVGGGLAVLALATIVWVVAGTLHELSRRVGATRAPSDADLAD